jgi:hypothetical protein
MDKKEQWYEFTDQEEVNRYFDRFLHITNMLEKICSSSVLSESDGLDDYVILTYIKKLRNTLNALRYKYWFLGTMDSRISSTLFVDSRDSGFPLRKEIHLLGADKADVSEKLKGFSSEKDIRDQIISYVVARKAVPMDLLYTLSQRKFFSVLRDKEIFDVNVSPEITEVKSPNENSKMYVIHWCTYDVQKNIPNIYIMVAEQSSEVSQSIKTNSEYRKSLFSAIERFSTSDIRLITMAREIDKEFTDIHPKSLKRVHVGPVYTNGITHHNDGVQRILEHVQDQRDNWVFAWSIETLLSRGSREISTGFFGKQREEIYDLSESNGMGKFEAGASDIQQSMIIPYDAYQALNDDSENPLKNVQTYVVDHDGNVIFM